MTHGTPRNHIWTFVAGTSEGTVFLVQIMHVHVMVEVITMFLNLWGTNTSVNQESISDGVALYTTYSTPVTPSGMERTASPAAHVAHYTILHILSSNYQPQPLTTLRPGSVWMIQYSRLTLQWN